MKKIFIFLSVILFFLSVILLCVSNFISIKFDDKSVPITTFKYKGHSYISFETGAIVHDPDCQYCYDKFD